MGNGITSIYFDDRHVASTRSYTKFVFLAGLLLPSIFDSTTLKDDIQRAIAVGKI